MPTCTSTEAESRLVVVRDLVGGEDGGDCLMSMESPSGVMKTFLNYIVVMVAHCECTMPLNYTLKMVKMVNFMLYAFCHNF